MESKIMIFKGDGIGPEIMDVGIQIIRQIETLEGRTFKFDYGRIGGDALDHHKTPLTSQDLEAAKSADAVLLGAVGGQKWDHFEGDMRPEKGLLNLRKELETYANIRQISLDDSLLELSPIKSERLKDGVDLFFIRELTGGIYFGDKGRKIVEGDQVAYDVESYSRSEIQRIARTAFDFSMKRSKKLASVDKMNVLESSRLWRDTVIEISKEYPEVELEHVLVDNCAMQLILNPCQFDCVLTNNIFGDILTDEASVLGGSIGMLPSMSIGLNGVNLYEPIHGSAPDIAGQDIANPIGMIKSIALMFKYSFGMEKASTAIETSINKTLSMGYRTKDIGNASVKTVGTKVISEQILKEIDNYYKGE